MHISGEGKPFGMTGANNTNGSVTISDTEEGPELTAQKAL